VFIAFLLYELSQKQVSKAFSNSFSGKYLRTSLFTSSGAFDNISSLSEELKVYSFTFPTLFSGFG